MAYVKVLVVDKKWVTVSLLHFYAVMFSFFPRIFRTRMSQATVWFTNQVNVSMLKNVLIISKV